MQELQTDPEVEAEATVEAKEKFLKFTGTKELEMHQPSCSFFMKANWGADKNQGMPG